MNSIKTERTLVMRRFDDLAEHVPLTQEKLSWKRGGSFWHWVNHTFGGGGGKVHHNNVNPQVTD